MSEENQKLKRTQARYAGKTKIADRESVWELIERGIIFLSFYDTEVTDLNKRHVDITQFGGVITDISGNIYDMAEYKARPSETNVFSPYAAIVQNMQEQDYTEGGSQYLLAGKMMHFFEQTRKLENAHFKNTFLAQCEDRKDYYAYPLKEKMDRLIMTLSVSPKT